MAQFEDHIRQAQENREFLAAINRLERPSRSVAWEVTMCFYTALHLVNAHLAKFDKHYQTHLDVALMIDPDNKFSDARVPEDVFAAYDSLQSLSRWARYLNGETKNGKLVNTINEKQLEKAIRHLNRILEWFDNTYPDCISKECPIRCREISIKQEFSFFQITF